MTELYERQQLHCEINTTRIWKRCLLEIRHILWRNVFYLQLCKKKVQKNKYETVRAHWRLTFSVRHPPSCECCRTDLSFESCLAFDIHCSNVKRCFLHTVDQVWSLSFSPSIYHNWFFQPRVNDIGDYFHFAHEVFLKSLNCVAS